MAKPVHHPIGSMWRIWDLHLHTPSSYDYLERTVTNEDIVRTLIEASVSVVAVTDHNTIDADRIRALQDLGKDQLIVLPGIEVRTELGGNNSVHMVAVFPEDSDLGKIWDNLKVHHKLVQQVEERGHDSVYVDFREFANDVHELSGLTIIHAGSKSNSIEEIANSTAFKQALKTDLAREASDLFEIANPKNIPDYANIVFPSIGQILPLVLCSDSHRLSNYTAPKCWVKADPSFYGLCQVLYDPWDRIQLADYPPALNTISQNKTKYIKSISFTKESESDLQEVWFDGVSLPLNPGLVVIIGNKGSGKSALSETIGLLGGCRHCERFSFLHEDRFLHGRKPKGSYFTGTLEWLDGSYYILALNESNDRLEERVHYIPQNYLETVCNELQVTDSGEFALQLEEVILSHVPREERANHQNLKSFIDYRTAEIEASLDHSRQKMIDLNREIVEIESRLSPAYEVALRQGLESKEKEFRVLEGSRPKPVPKPSLDPDASPEIKKKLTEIERLSEEFSILEDRVKQNARDQVKEKQIVVSCTKLLQALENFEAQYEDLRTIWDKEGTAVGVDISQVVQFKIDRVPLADRLKSSQDSMKNLQADMDSERDGTLANKVALAKETLNALRLDLTAPEQEYRKYLDAEKDWIEKQKQLLGDENTSGTLVWYQNQLNDIKSLPEYLNDLLENRTKLVSTIYLQLQKWRMVYEQVYEPVQKYIDEHPLMSKKMQFEFSAAITDVGLSSSFFEIIHQGRKGSFCRDGEATLKKLIKSADFTSAEGVLTLVKEVLEHLSEDKRPNEGGAVNLEGQLKDGKSRLDLYNLLFSLDYLRPTYSLKWSGKDLDQLSPGEKGTLLLVFYLLIDKDTGPLLIDQPEENLDNQTVFGILVPSINEARRRRQIVLVTHNPNLAVVCDADQVIKADLDVNNLCKMTYKAGAIENPVISAAIVDVLEGTKPAFEKREHKYTAAMPDWIL